MRSFISLVAMSAGLALACAPGVEVTTGSTSSESSSDTQIGSTSSPSSSGEPVTTLMPTVTSVTNTTSEGTTVGAPTSDTVTEGGTDTQTTGVTATTQATSESSGGECGNGVVEPGEDCDEGGLETAMCDTDCSFAVCGDGYLNTSAGEECDPGDPATDQPGCVGPDTALATEETLCLNGQLMFVTSKTYLIDDAIDPPDDVFYGRDDDDPQRVSADERCQQEAALASLEGLYRAWLSNSGDMSGALAHVGLPGDDSQLLVGYRGQDPENMIEAETFVFSVGWDGSYGIVPTHVDDAAFTRPVIGGYPAMLPQIGAWTASTPKGALDVQMGAAQACDDWHDNADSLEARLGRPGIPYQWSQSQTSPKALKCDQRARFYCIEAP